jgi:hypothetical protein
MASVSKAIVAVEMARLARSPRQHMLDLIADLLVIVQASVLRSHVAPVALALPCRPCCSTFCVPLLLRCAGSAYICGRLPIVLEVRPASAVTVCERGQGVGGDT